jgi:2-furoyl-CoA dehydrogenase FAD binding subunit
MKPASFGYLRPASVAEACEALARHGEDARILAGGQSLAAMLNMRLVRPALLIDINRIDTLANIDAAGDTVVTGAVVRQAGALADARIRSRVPLLVLALPHVGHYQTRNRGTLAGSIAHGDPSAEIPLVLATLGGEIELKSARRTRRMPAADFFQSALVTARAADEMITAVHWPAARGRTRFAFEEFSVRGGDYALVAVACALHEERRTVRLGFGGCGGAPQIVELGCTQEIDAEAIAQIAADASGRIECRGDLQASAAYRQNLAAVLARRALATAGAREPAVA